MADSLDSGSSVHYARAGSSPASRTTSFLQLHKHARVVELADSLDSGSSVHYARAGSSPASRTTSFLQLHKHARVVELADSLDSGSSVHYARAGSSPASRTKKEGHPYGCPSFLVQALLLRKSGRLRADDLTCKGNPTKVSLAHIPFLAAYKGAHGQQNLWAVTKRQTSIRVPAFLTHRFCAAALTSGIFALFL